MIPPAAYILIGYGAIFVMSIVLHEVAHGWVAYRCGDPTAYLMGRLTLNPIKHIDPFMTIILPAMCIWMGMPLFGGAKPVPINPYHLRHRVRDGRMVDLAGVAVNFTIAWLLAGILHLLLHFEVIGPDSPHFVIMGMGVFTNILLMCFNLMPIPPLDGSHFLRSFLPWSAQQVFARLDRFGIMIIMAVLVLVPGFHTLLWWLLEATWNHVFRLNAYDRIYNANLLDLVFKGFATAMGR